MNSLKQKFEIEHKNINNFALKRLTSYFLCCFLDYKLQVNVWSDGEMQALLLCELVCKGSNPIQYRRNVSSSVLNALQIRIELDSTLFLDGAACDHCQHSNLRK